MRNNPLAPLHEAWLRHARRRARAWGLRYCDKIGLTDLYPDGPSFKEVKIRYEDQAFIYRLVLKLAPRMIVEFGSGISTITMAVAGDAEIHFVETRQFWADNTLKMLPERVRHRITSHISRVRWQGDHHVYSKLPDVVPDLIYLDGPDGKDVEGTNTEITKPISADPLYYEDRMMPGAAVLVDGRHVNVRFLDAHWRRRWTRTDNRKFDNTLYILKA